MGLPPDNILYVCLPARLCGRTKPLSSGGLWGGSLCWERVGSENANPRGSVNGSGAAAALKGIHGQSWAAGQPRRHEKDVQRGGNSPRR